eukprot:scaffold192_cov114-Cylindrotheca_fusiformis.AAC.3
MALCSLDVVSFWTDDIIADQIRVFLLGKFDDDVKKRNCSIRQTPGPGTNCIATSQPYIDRIFVSYTVRSLSYNELINRPKAWHNRSESIDAKRGTSVSEEGTEGGSAAVFPECVKCSCCSTSAEK